MKGPGKGGAVSLVLIVQATEAEVSREFSNRDINPNYVGAVRLCKAPLWGRCLDLDLDYLSITPKHTPVFEASL